MKTLLTPPVCRPAITLALINSPFFTYVKDGEMSGCDTRRSCVALRD